MKMTLTIRTTEPYTNEENLSCFLNMIIEDICDGTHVNQNYTFCGATGIQNASWNFELEKEANADAMQKV